MFGNELAEILSGGFGILLIIIGIIYWLMIPLLGRWLASEKGYSTMNWFWLCFFFGIFALITISGAPAKSKNKNEIVHSEINKKEIFWNCPKCGEKNPNNTFKCEKCNYSLN